MSYKLKRLTDLRDKVKAGDHFPKGLRSNIFGHNGNAKLCLDAYNGSLDAAKALHEAVLPGWGWEISGPYATLRQYQKKIKCKDENPARAWLLAILDALIAKEGNRP